MLLLLYWMLCEIWKDINYLLCPFRALKKYMFLFILLLSLKFVVHQIGIRKYMDKYRKQDWYLQSGEQFWAPSQSLDVILGNQWIESNHSKPQFSYFYMLIVLIVYKIQNPLWTIVFCVDVSQNHKLFWGAHLHSSQWSLGPYAFALNYTTVAGKKISVSHKFKWAKNGILLIFL